MYAAAATGAREAAWHLQAQREIRRADVEEQQNKCTQPHVAPALVREEQHVKASNMFAANTEEEEEEEEDNNDEEDEDDEEDEERRTKNEERGRQPRGAGR